MAEGIYDHRLILAGLQEGALNVEQAYALFRENREAARYFLVDRLGEAFHEPQAKTSTDLDSPAGRTLEVCWKVLGTTSCVNLFRLHDGPLVECYFKRKLRYSLDQFTDHDLIRLDDHYRGKPMHQVVVRARAKKLVPLANLLLKNPEDLNRDIAEIQKRISAYHFTPELNEVLDKVEQNLAGGGDQFDQAALLKHLRTFFEKLHEQVGTKLRTEKPEAADGTDLTKCGHAIDYLQRQGVLTDPMRALARALYGVLSEEGVHALKSEQEYVRLCRNQVAEYALVLFFELERWLQT